MRGTGQPSTTPPMHPLSHIPISANPNTLPMPLIMSIIRILPLPKCFKKHYHLGKSVEVVKTLLCSQALIGHIHVAMSPPWLITRLKFYACHVVQCCDHGWSVVKEKVRLGTRGYGLRLVFQILYGPEEVVPNIGNVDFESQKFDLVQNRSGRINGRLNWKRKKID